MGVLEVVVDSVDVGNDVDDDDTDVVEEIVDVGCGWVRPGTAVEVSADRSPRIFS